MNSSEGMVLRSRGEGYMCRGTALIEVNGNSKRSWSMAVKTCFRLLLKVDLDAKAWCHLVCGVPCAVSDLARGCIRLGWLWEAWVC